METANEAPEAVSPLALLAEADVQLVDAREADRVVAGVRLDELAARVKRCRRDAAEGEADAAPVEQELGTVHTHFRSGLWRL